MKHSTQSGNLMKHKPKELRLLYEPLSMLYILGEERSKIKATSPLPQTTGLGLTAWRQKFVDALAQIGACKKGYTIAVALGKEDGNIIAYVAGNMCLEPQIIPFLNDTIKEICTHCVNDEEKLVLFPRLLREVLDFHQDRIFGYYQKLLQAVVPACMPIMRTRAVNGPADLREELHSFEAWYGQSFLQDGIQLPKTDMRLFARRCSDALQAGLCDVLKRFIHQEEEYVNLFEKFLNLLRKSSMLIETMEKLFDACFALRDDFGMGMIEVRGISPSQEQRIPLLKKKATTEGAVHRMCSDPEKEKVFQPKIQAIYPSDAMSEKMGNFAETRHTKVHPELLLINHMDMMSNDSGFLDSRDKYIACSKRSCLLCYQYIYCHPNHYSPISTCYKLDLNWRLPDVGYIEEKAAIRFRHQQLVLRKLIEYVRSSLEREVNNRWGELLSSSEAELEYPSPVSTPSWEDDIEMRFSLQSWNENSESLSPRSATPSSNTRAHSDYGGTTNLESDDEDDGGVAIRI